MKKKLQDNSLKKKKGFVRLQQIKLVKDHCKAQN